MKILTAILSFYILLLSVQPALAAIDFSKKTECCCHCCGNDCEKPAPEKKQQDDSCNPLMSCSSCIGFVFSFHTISFKPVSQVSEHYSIYRFNAVSEIAIPVWQPPKIS